MGFGLGSKHKNGMIFTQKVDLGWGLTHKAIGGSKLRMGLGLGLTEHGFEIDDGFGFKTGGGFQWVWV